MPHGLLEGPPKSTEEYLRERIAQLEDELRLDKEHLSQAVSDARKQSMNANRAIANLRRQLEPLYSALRMVFGEIESAGATIETVESAGVAAPINAGKYEPWKQKFPGKAADMIQALVTYENGLTRTQWAKFTNQDARSGSFSQNIFKLNSAGLLEKSGDKYRLKRL